MQGKPQITLDDIYRLDLTADHAPDQPWQLEYVRHWIKQGRHKVLVKMIEQADRERREVSAMLARKFNGQPIDVTDVGFTDAQMEGTQWLHPGQVCYARLRGLPLVATPAGLFLREAPDASDRAGVRARAAWLYLEASWHRMKEEAAKAAGQSTI